MIRRFILILLLSIFVHPVFGQGQVLEQFHDLYREGKKEEANKLLKNLQKESLAHYHHALGTKNYYEGQYQEAKKNYGEAAVYYQKSKDASRLANVKNNYAICCYFQDSLYKAYKIHLEVKKIREEKNSPKIGGTYNNLGLVLMGLKKDSEAIKYYKKAIHYKLTNNDSAAISNSFNNIGLAYKHLQQYDSSLYYFKAALTIANKYEQLKMKSNALNNLSGLYIKTHQPDSAKRYIYEALKAKKQYGNTKSQSRSLLNLANILKTQKHREQAYTIVDSLSQVFQKNEQANLYELHLIYDFLYQMDSLRANYKRALQNNLKKNYYYNELQQSHQASAIDSLNKKLELSEKNEQIITLEQQKNIDQKQLKLQKNRFIYLSIIFTLSVLALLFVLWFLRKNIQQKRKINTINKYILQNNKLLQQILSVLSHDLKNSVYGNLEVIQLMRKKIDRLDPDKVKLLISQIEEDAITTKKTLDEIIAWLVAAYNFKEDKNQIPVHKVIVELEQEFSKKLMEKNITIDNQFKKDEIQAPKALIKSVFRNIFTNILAHSNENTTVQISGTDSTIKIVELDQFWSQDELKLLNNKSELYSSLGVLIIHSITNLIQAEVVYLNTSEGAVLEINFNQGNG